MDMKKETSRLILKIVNFKKVNRDPEKLPKQDEDRVLRFYSI